MDGWMEINKYKERYADRQTDRQTDGLHTQTDAPKHTLCAYTLYAQTYISKTFSDISYSPSARWSRSLKLAASQHLPMQLC